MRRWPTVTVSVFAIVILLVSGLFGLVRATSPQVVHIKNLNPVILQVGQTGTLRLNLSGGYVSSTKGYTLFWFFGWTNATAVQAKTQSVQNLSTTCTLSSPCSANWPDSISVQYAKPGTYDVSVTAYDGTMNNYDIATVNVTVIDSFSLCFVQAGNVPPHNINVLEGHAVELYAQTTPADARFTWNWGDGNQTSGKTSISGNLCTTGISLNIGTHDYAHSGIYLVTLTASDPWGYVSQGQVTVNVSHSYPTVSLIAPSSGYVGSETQFTATVSDANSFYAENQSKSLTYIWNFGDSSVNVTSSTNSWNTSSPVSIVSHAYSSTGQYTVKVWVTDGENPINSHSGTSASASVTIGTPTIHCIGGSQKAGITIPWIGSGCGIGWISPWVNATWTAPQGAPTTYGEYGRVASYSYGSQNVGLTVKSQTGTTLYSGSPSVTVTDVAPTVGVTGAFVTPTITTTFNSCNFASVTATLYENVGISLENSTLLGTNCHMGGMLLASTPLTLAAMNLYLGNSYTVKMVMTPLSSVITATMTLTFAGTGATPVSPPAWQFNPANPPTLTWYVNVMHYALGEPVFLATEMFSQAQVQLTTTWNYGDGSSNFVYQNQKPTTVGPTLVYQVPQHVWAANAVYTLTVTTQDPVSGGQGGLTGINILHITEVGALTINDTAPTLSISTPGTWSQGVPANWTTSTGEHDLNVTANVPTWQMGDGTTYSGTTVKYTYNHTATYAIIVTEKTPGGSTAKNYTMFTPGNAKPTAKIAWTPTHPVLGGVVTFSGNLSGGGTTGPGNMTFLWTFGDGASASARGLAGATVGHIYSSTGRFTIKLVATNDEGQSGTSYANVTVSSLVLSNTTLPAVTVYAGQSTWFHANLTKVSQSLLPYLNASWSWGGGWGGQPSVTFGSYGPSTVHTYLMPGVYTQNVTLSYAGLTSYTARAQVKVIDPLPTLSAPFEASYVYGENHTSIFTVTGLGTWADSHGPEPWNFTFAWGDGSGSTFVQSVTGSATATHIYTQAGMVLLNVTVTSPQYAAYASTRVVPILLYLNPDSDGDGLPNIFETLITHTSPYQTSSPNKDPYPWGTGFTDYLVASFNGLLTNLTSDPDGDGLTSAQEIFGSVTGYTSNPLDSNTAGDGIPDGGHFFTDKFPASAVVPFNKTSGNTFVTIPGVWYGGVPTGFNQSRLTVEISTAKANLSALRLFIQPAQLTSTSMGLPLPNPTNVSDTYYLLNDSPQTGATSNYQLTLANYSWAHNWTVVVNSSVMGMAGSITSAVIADSYYTNPSQADPYHQGMLEGNSLTTPIINCSGSTTETFPVVDWKAFKVVNVSYWPYTETYKKLSVLQGIPYEIQNNSTIYNLNHASGNCTNLSVSPHIWGLTATYLGDADFGMSPWNPDVAGDPYMTNGMKALGAFNYTSTVWQYLTTAGQPYPVNGANPYPSDPLIMNHGYTGALDPSAFSTAGDGVADTYAINPLQPLALEVQLNWSVDPNSITSCGTFGDQVAVYLLGNEYTSTIFTPSVAVAQSPCWWASNLNFTFNDKYLLPLSNYQTASSFVVEFDLFHQDVCALQSASQCYSNDSTLPPSQIVGSISSTGWLKTPRGSEVNASVRVVPLTREPFVLFNTTEELASLPVYGYRYVGEQQFYAFYVNSNDNYGGTPFVSGLNTVLESRKAFLNTPLDQMIKNQSGTTNTCLGKSQLEVRSGTQTSATGIAGMMVINVTSGSCASSLTLWLRTLNSTGAVIGQWHQFNTSHLELLGLGLLGAQIAAYSNMSYTSQSVSGLYGDNPFQGALQGISDLWVAAWVAVGNFLATVASAAVALGQWILGGLQKAASVAATYFQAALAILQLIWSFIVALATSMVRVATLPLVLGAIYLITCVNTQLREINYETAHGRTLSQAEQDNYVQFWSCIAGPAFWAGVALSVAILVVIAIIDGFTFGAGFLIGLVIGLLITGALAAISYSHVNTGPIQQMSSTPGIQLAAAAEGFANSTTGHPPSTNNSTATRAFNDNQSSNCNWGSVNQSNLSGCSWSVNQIMDWSFLGGLTVFLLDYKGNQLSLDALQSAIRSQNPVLKSFNWVSTALSFVSVILDFGALLINPEPRLAAIGLGIGIVAVIISVGCLVYQYKFGGSENPVTQEDYIALGLSVASTSISAVMYAMNY
jgi:hypothetical protein